MTRRALSLLACAPLLALTACPAPLSRSARAQDAAQELNLHTRFGRMEVAIDKVAAKERDGFVRRHRAWGSRVRIADTELAGMRLTSDEDAEVSVKVAWFRPDEGELHVTVLRQKWHDNRGDWLLVAEERADGDTGLLGDEAPAAQASAPDAGAPQNAVASPRARANAQFRTIRIGGNEAP